MCFGGTLFPLESIHCVCICTAFIFQTKKNLMIVLATFQHYLNCGLLYTATDMRVFWIPLTYVWPEYRTYDTWEYILTLFLLLACWTDFRIWIAYDVSASCMAVINSIVYLKTAVGNSEPTRINWTPSRHVLRVFRTFSQGRTTHSPSLTWPWKMKSGEWWKHFECIC
jgi:hypothetical protein